eukprot:TRINITY_DN2071_c0_g2_i7.p1 TRINITY_DN2071_c0_g2~~TRINITY_DN2071_c0_g2_i7.p1  ORF type:complete len:141 (+),score=13.31 TRINITY_DN2071_c0_g2_i7:188-610(+)
MGKESLELKRQPETPKSFNNTASKHLVHWMLTQQWSSPGCYPSLKNVSEDGHVTVLIRSPASEITLICKGMKQRGNSYGRLLGELRRGGLAGRKRSNVRFLIKKGIFWESVDEAVDEFSSNSYIMAIVSLKVGKSIVKTE